MVRDSTVNRDRMVVVPSSLSVDGNAPSEQPSIDFTQQIQELKKEQEMQKQMLWHTFNEKTKQLELQHKLELEHKIQYAAHSHGVFQELQERERIVAEEKEQNDRRDREAPAVIKRKENCRSNASPEVKQILMSFLMNKKQATTANGITSQSPFRNRGVVKSSSGESLPSGAVASSHPYKIPQPPIGISKYDSDFPLRKTASEPNLLKIRLKQSVIERKARIGPAAVRRQERLLQAAHRRLHKQSTTLTNCSSSTSDSGPNSPPTLTGGSRGSPTSAPIQEENEEPQYQSGTRSSINDLSLFSSPSMPNISLGRPHIPNAHQSTTSNLAILNALHHQAALALNAQQSPMQGNPSLHSGIYYTGLPLLDNHNTGMTQQRLPLTSELPPQAHAATNLNSLGNSTNLVVRPIAPVYTHQPHPITDAQVAHARLNKQGHRPLGRTQSAPLPLGHPMLGCGTTSIVQQTHYENIDAERQASEQHHMLLTQKIRQTVLTRSGVCEQQFKEGSGEVIDLTDKKQPPRTMLTTSCSVITSTTSQQNIALTTNQQQLQHMILSCNDHSKQEPCFQLAASVSSGTIPKITRDQEYLQQQRELLYMRSMEDAIARNIIRPLSRTLSSPLVPLGSHNLVGQIIDGDQNLSSPCNSLITKVASGTNSLEHIPPAVNLSLPHKRGLVDGSHKIKTGLAFDNLMLKHACICGNNTSHPEHSGRLQSVWARLIETGLAARCDKLRSRKATLEEIQSVHTEAHTMLFGSNQINRQKIEANPLVNFVRLSCGGVGVDLDTTWNEHHTAAAARMAAGCVIDLAFKTSKGDIKNGFAVVRPPGHHAEENVAMGFCFFNSVAIAAKLLRLRLPSVEKILIVDWDVHHGNGTQQTFYETSTVLYLSIHRHDDGNFFPGTGGPTECGTGSGVGYNVNISWSGGLNPPLGDAEYLAAFRTLVMPIAKEFNPDIVLVSAGFDAAAGHPAPLGGYLVSPACFGYMTRELMQLADGKIVLALEGGYDLPAICDSAQECIRALLGDELTKISDEELSRSPCPNAINILQKTIAIQISHWPCVRRLAHTLNMSSLEAIKAESEEFETITAMAGLSMQPPQRILLCENSEEPMEQDESK